MPVINTMITETTNITENGLHDVAKYTTANVDVQPNLEELEVTPSTSSQTFTPTTDGYSSVSVDAVDSSIDNNIIPENIKKDVEILGVTGNYEGGGNNSNSVQYIVDGNGVLQKPNTIITLSNNVIDLGERILQFLYDGSEVAITGSINFSSLHSLSYYGSLMNTFNYCEGITSIDLSNLEVISGMEVMSNMCCGCTSLNNINLNSLISITGDFACQGAFSNTAITSLNLPSLTLITGASSCNGMFQDCYDLTSINLPVLEVIGGENEWGEYGSLSCENMFTGCTSLTSVSFPALTTIIGEQACTLMFQACSSLTSISFPALTTIDNISAFDCIVLNVDGCTLHFPSNLQPIIETLDGYPDFGGTNTSILFDL